jgi:putative transposase
MQSTISVRGLTSMELQRAHDPLRSALVVSPRAESVLALTTQSPISVRGLTAMELQRAHDPLCSALVVSPRAESVLALTTQSPISVRGLTSMELQRPHDPLRSALVASPRAESVLTQHLIFYYPRTHIVDKLRSMYAWRQMTEAARHEAVAQRQQQGLPWHRPPHFGEESRFYHISAACYGHAQILQTPQRRTEFESALLDALKEQALAEVRAWTVLPDHYHLLLKADLRKLGKVLHKIHNRTSTRWNGEDGTRGRKVWHAFSDRRIRGDVHYYRTINYIHANPVKHGHVDDSSEWPWSSLAAYFERFGREKLRRWWREYPITGYGSGWDD